MGKCYYKPIIIECELVAAVLAVLLWGICAGNTRLIILRTDNMHVSHWLNGAKSRNVFACRLLRRILAWCVMEGVGIIPRYVRSGRNITADGLTRWIDEECEEWGYSNRTTRSSTHGIWNTWSAEWSEPRPEPPLTTVMMIGHMVNYFKRRGTQVAQWRSGMYSTTRIPNEWRIQKIYLEIMEPRAFEFLPGTVSEYSTVNLHVLIGSG